MVKFCQSEALAGILPWHSYVQNPYWLQLVDDFAKLLVFERGSGDFGYVEMNDSEYWISGEPAEKSP